MRGKDVVEERARPTGPQPLNGLGSTHSELHEDQTGDESRAIEAHAAVREDTVAGLDQSRAQIRHGIQFGQVRESLIEDGEVNVENLVWNGRDAVIQAAIEIDDCVYATLLEWRPFIDSRRDEERAGIIDLVELHVCNLIGVRQTAGGSATREEPKAMSKSDALAC